jgi:hypothetical protein
LLADVPGAAGEKDLVAGRGQVVAHQFPELRVVVNDQDTMFHGSRQVAVPANPWPGVPWKNVL